MSNVPRIAPVSGHIVEAQRMNGVVLYAKWRDAHGQHQRKLGPLWENKGRPPAGWLSRKQARALLDEILVAARQHPSATRSRGCASSRSPRTGWITGASSAI